MILKSNQNQKTQSQKRKVEIQELKSTMNEMRNLLTNLNSICEILEIRNIKRLHIIQFEEEKAKRMMKS